MTAVASFFALVSLALAFALVTQPDSVFTEHERANAAVATITAQSTQMAMIRAALSTPTPNSVCSPRPHC